MRHTVLALVVAFVVGPAWAEDNRYREQGARTAIAEMAQDMESARAKALSAGGPAHAFEVCRTVAPAMAAARRAAMDAIDVARTSLHVLNPANAPDPWERRVLEGFATRAARGEDPSVLEHSEAVEIEGGARIFRFMKAVVADPGCLACHGNVAPPEVARQRLELFPQGQVAPWRPGGLAGAYSARQPM
jgi:hypothetical protein